MDPIANLHNVPIIAAAGEGGTIWTNNTLPVLPEPPTVVVGHPRGARLVEFANLFLLHESMRFASSNPWVVERRILEVAENVISALIWNYTIFQQGQPAHLQRLLEGEFVDTVAGNIPLLKAVAFGTFKLRIRFRQAYTVVEAEHPNGAITEAERVQGHGFLRRDDNGNIPTPAVIRGRVVNDLLAGNVYLHSGRRDANNHIIQDFRSPAIYAIVQRAVYHGQFPGELESITHHCNPQQFADSFGQRVPIGAVLLAAVTDRWILDCRSLHGTREDRSFASDVYHDVFAKLRDRYIFLRSNPQWAAEDAAYRTHMASVFMRRIPNYNIFDTPNFTQHL
ncbi:hypothetical protein BV25DRAFT_1911962 [Artomyces pyxidatus]|uniref:Uncharacterized protein n=1 Tax=Artomyces pyxidatus TaxID=48021 RepID=A0ACB8TFV7_9AGAM|nr:hypothetical protein BV25DRAFT_1911962 [Artomyces pyxidatus]